MVSFPLKLADAENPKHQVSLTEAGRGKLAKAKAQTTPNLEAGKDYVVKAGSFTGWYAFPDFASTQHIRHDWVLKRRLRPMVPSFTGSPLPKHHGAAAERNSRLALAYFRPWTMLPTLADEQVVGLADMKEASSWQDVFRNWLASGQVAEHGRRYLQNFLSVHRMRPANEEDDEENSDDMLSDEARLGHSSVCL